MWVARSYLSFASSRYVLYLESTIAFLILIIHLRIRETERETLTGIYAASKSRLPLGRPTELLGLCGSTPGNQRHVPADNLISSRSPKSGSWGYDLPFQKSFNNADVCAGLVNVFCELTTYPGRQKIDSRIQR
jgi:hypothetical protein